MEGRASEDQEQTWQEDDAAAAMARDDYGNSQTYADFASSSHPQRECLRQPEMSVWMLHVQLRK